MNNLNDEQLLELALEEGLTLEQEITEAILVSGLENTEEVRDLVTQAIYYKTFGTVNINAVEAVTNTIVRAYDVVKIVAVKLQRA